VREGEEQLEGVRADLEKTTSDLKQAQNQLVLKDEQLIHIQDNMLKVSASLSHSSSLHFNYPLLKVKAV